MVILQGDPKSLDFSSRQTAIMHWDHGLDGFINEEFIKEFASQVKADMETSLYEYCVSKGAEYQVADGTHDWCSHRRHASRSCYRSMESYITESNTWQQKRRGVAPLE